MKNNRTRISISKSASKKEKNVNPKNLFTEAEVLERLGLTKEEIDSVGEIEIE